MIQNYISLISPPDTLDNYESKHYKLVFLIFYFKSMISHRNYKSVDDNSCRDRGLSLLPPLKLMHESLYLISFLVPFAIVELHRLQSHFPKQFPMVVACPKAL